MKNFIPIDFQDSKLSDKIAKYITEHASFSTYIKASPLIVVDLTSYENCRPLVDAVNQICSWQDINYILFLNARPGLEIIHQDSAEHEYYWALNIPILNCKDTYTSIYDPLPGEQGITVSKDDGGYILWQKNQVKEIDRMYLTQPMIFNIASIHCIHNSSDQPRVSISIRMKCDLLEKYKLMQR
jgi:hypothetical protein